MKDKMSTSDINNTPPKEFIEYLHNLFEEIIVNNESFEKYKKWLKKYCDEYEVDYQQMEIDISDFIELIDEYVITQKEIIKKSIYRISKNLYISDEQISLFLKQSVDNPIQNQAIMPSFSDKTADWFNTAERRLEWWNKLEEQWKKAFKQVFFKYDSNIEDSNLVKIFDAKKIKLVTEGKYNQGDPGNLSEELNNLSGLENLTNLEELDCGNNNINSLVQINNLVNLRKLYCYNNKIDSFKGIENLLLISDLDCSENKIHKLIGIENLNNLTYLDISENNISTLKDLNNTTIANLVCSFNNLTNLNGIERLTNLEHLDCSNNMISEIHEVVTCTFLEVFYCSFNKINSLPSNGIESLIELDISNNELVDLNFIENFTNIEYITCYNNKIKSISGINVLENIIIFECPHINSSDLVIFDEFLSISSENGLTVKIDKIASNVDQSSTSIMNLETLKSFEIKYPDIEIYYKHISLTY